MTPFPPPPINTISTSPPKEADKDQFKALIPNLQERIQARQRLLFADGKQSLLIVLQGMDAAGKDGTINAILHGMTALGCTVTGFRKPSEREMNHDFLWRVHQVVPEKGRVVIFNRSHYEDVLVQRVHKWVDEDRVKRRFAHINAFEQLLREENGTIVLKFFLHVSKDEQLERLNERKTERSKMWKYNPGDFKEREYWDAYMAAYDDVFAQCGPDNPWHIIPADKNWYKEYLVLNTILQTLEGLDLQYPHYSEND